MNQHLSLFKRSALQTHQPTQMTAWQYLHMCQDMVEESKDLHSKGHTDDAFNALHNIAENGISRWVKCRGLQKLCAEVAKTDLNKAIAEAIKIPSLRECRLALSLIKAEQYNGQPASRLDVQYHDLLSSFRLYRRQESPSAYRKYNARSENAIIRWLSQHGHNTQAQLFQHQQETLRTMLQNKEPSSSSLCTPIPCESLCLRLTNFVYQLVQKLAPSPAEKEKGSGLSSVGALHLL